MMNLRLGVMLFGFGVFAANASAQYGNGYQSSVNYFATSVSDPSVTVQYVGGGPYTNGISAQANGKASNSAMLSESPDDYVQAVNDSENLDGGIGYASQFNGINYFIDFTNTSDVVQTFGVSVNIIEEDQTSGIATAVSYAGFEEYDGAHAMAYNTLTMVNGVATEDPSTLYNSVYYTFYYGGYYGAYADSEGGFTDTLSPNQTIEVQVWASGSTSVNSATTTPGPVAALPFALGLLARRRWRS